MLVNISRKVHITNEEVGRKIQVAIGEYKVLTLVKKRKPKQFGHVSMSSGLGLAKTILQCTTKGKINKKNMRQTEEEVGRQN